MSKVQNFKQKDRGRGQGHPIMYGKPRAAYHFSPFSDGGGFPIGFLEWVYNEWNASPNEVLHICSGSVISGIRVDIRRKANPDIVADAVNLPFANSSFQWIIADPPYAKEYAENLYGTGNVYPSPHSLTRECLRILKPNGRFGLLHPMVPKFRRPGKLVRTYGITTGIGYNIRAFSVLTKLDDVNRMEKP